MTNGEDAELPAERAGSSVPEIASPSQPAPMAPDHSGSVAQVPRQRAFPLTGAEQFWYILHCIYFGAAYFAKIPTKKALSDVGLAEMTGWERFWYMVQCIAFGSGYLAKVPVKKALSEAGFGHRTGAEQFWYVLLCIYLGVGYFTKLPMK